MLRQEIIAFATTMFPAFQWAPTLGGECYKMVNSEGTIHQAFCFNGHPPLGVNATWERAWEVLRSVAFQWAPTLGGECYVMTIQQLVKRLKVSMGTHPWG